MRVVANFISVIDITVTISTVTLAERNCGT